MLFVCGIIGGFVGLAFGTLTNGSNFSSGTSFLEQYAKLQFSIADLSCVFLLICDFSFIIFILVHYFRIKKLGKQLNIVDTDLIEGNENGADLQDSFEKKAEFGMTLTNMMMILNIVFFGAGNYCFSKRLDNHILFTVMYVTSMFSIFYSLVMQKNYVNSIKLFHTNIKASIYDTKFQKKWLEGCDEAEQMLIYKAIYHTYMKTQKILAGIICVLMLLGLFIEISLLPLFVTTFLWLSSNIIYFYEAKKIQHTEK